MAQINTDLEILKTARDNMKTALEEKGQIVTKDIRTYAAAISNIPTGGGDVKLFDTVEEMQQDETAQEGDLAVVYREEIQPVTGESEFDSCIFPNGVVLNQAFTDDIYGTFRPVEMGGGWFDMSIELSPTEFRCDITEDDIQIRIKYTSDDGITYTRTDGGEKLQEFGTTIKWGNYEPWNDVIGNFMKIGGNYFGGVFEYRNDTGSNAFMLNIGPKNSQDYTQGIIYDLEKMNFNVQDVYDVYNVGQNTGNYNLLYVVDSFDNNGYPQTISVYPSYILIKDMNTNKLYVGAGNVYSATKPTGTVIVAHIDMINKTYTTETIGYLDNILLTNNYYGRAYYGTTFAEIDSEYWWFYKKNNNGWVMITDSVDYYQQGEVTVPNFFEYKYWNINSQLDTTSDYVYEKTVYGKNGVENGTLTTNVSNSFVDVNAEVYAKIQAQYENMQPRVLTDQDKTIDKSIKVIPCKSDGTPLLDTSSVTNMSSMFSNCSNLTTIPLLDTSNVTSMYNMFSNCSNLTTTPLLDTSNVIYMSQMFNNCSNLVTIPQLNTSNVTSMSNMFNKCSNLVTIPQLNTSSVTDMSQMFVNCSNLISVPQLDTSNVTNMRNLFAYCSSLVDVPVLNASSVTDMTFMFLNCSSLSNESLNNILATCISATNMTQKTLARINLTEEQATICTTLSNYQAFVNAGWTTGY